MKLRLLLASLPLLLAGRFAAQCSSEVFAEPYGAGTPGALGVPELRNVGAAIALEPEGLTHGLT